MKRSIISIISRLALVALAVVTVVSSCGLIYEDLEKCPRGVSLRFVYDYNMEYANAFHSKVDCITLYVYDGSGNFVTTCTESSSKLADESYRMVVDLPNGDYHFVAYGGMDCEASTFSTKEEPREGSHLNSLQVEMAHQSYISNIQHHDHYHGTLDVTIDSDMYKDCTLYLKKNTNNLRVVMQQLNNEPLSSDDFIFRVEDTNTLHDHQNEPVSDQVVTYKPWAEGQQVVGVRSDNSQEPPQVAFAEFSMSRLHTANSPRLIIERKEDNRVVVDIPLNDYLLLIKSMQHKNMSAQEFLDRESDWSMVFFLDEVRTWWQVHIIVNGWTVRLNGIDF